jgi:hypothetical protein
MYFSVCVVSFSLAPFKYYMSLPASYLRKGGLKQGILALLKKQKQKDLSFEIELRECLGQNEKSVEVFSNCIEIL